MHKLVSAILLIFGAAIIGLIYLWPEWQSYETLRARTTALHATQQELEELSLDRDKLLEKINEVSPENLERLARALPEGQDARGLLVLLEHIINQHSLDLTNIALENQTVVGKTPPSAQPRPAGGVSTPKPASETKELPFKIGVNASYDNFKNLLISLEKSLRILDVTNIEFSAPGGETATANFNLQGRTYYQ